MGQKIFTRVAKKIFTRVNIQVERFVSIHLSRVSNKVGDTPYETWNIVYVPNVF